MFFNAKQLHHFVEVQHAHSPSYYRSVCSRVTNGHYIAPAPLTLASAKKTLKQARALLLAQDRTALIHAGLSKFLRPWHVVPAIRDFIPPQGDYGIGVEVEMGFVSQDAAQIIASNIIDWKYVAMDTEGGTHGIEVTFPPVLLSKFDGRSQASRYLRLLAAKNELVFRHDPNIVHVGTHINVSKGGVNVDRHVSRIHRFNQLAEYSLSTEEKWKYFGRNPYAYAHNRDKYFEYKLFDSQTDWKRLRQYVNIAVAITDWITAPVTSRSDIDSLREALELGYNK